MENEEYVPAGLVQKIVLMPVYQDWKFTSTVPVSPTEFDFMRQTPPPSKKVIRKSTLPQDRRYIYAR
jgi:hypothetical protein